MPGPHLLYVADPMCSWCWGFAPVVEAIREQFGPALPIRLLLGGLRPGTTEPLDHSRKREIREHWEHVHEATGQPFEFGFFDREGFVYDTEPVSRAVVVARRHGMEAALDLLGRAHAAFYAENRDVTDAEVLADLAAGAGLDRQGFLSAFHEEEARQEVWQDFAMAQQAGVRGFPCLLAGEGEDNRYGLVTSGWQPAGRILPVLERWLETVRQSDATPASEVGWGRE